MDHSTSGGDGPITFNFQTAGHEGKQGPESTNGSKPDTGPLSRRRVTHPPEVNYSNLSLHEKISTIKGNLLKILSSPDPISYDILADYLLVYLYMIQLPDLLSSSSMNIGVLTENLREIDFRGIDKFDIFSLANRLDSLNSLEADLPRSLLSAPLYNLKEFINLSLYPEMKEIVRDMVNSLSISRQQLDSTTRWVNGQKVVDYASLGLLTPNGEDHSEIIERFGVMAMAKLDKLAQETSRTELKILHALGLDWVIFLEVTKVQLMYKYRLKTES